jgi:hypothetical protein
VSAYFCHVLGSRYNVVVRRLLCSLIFAGLTLGLHASVPSVKSSATLNRSANPQFESPYQSRPALMLTAAPANISFYDEFYPAITPHQTPSKTGVLHWVGSLIKKGRQKIALLSRQKFF